MMIHTLEESYDRCLADGCIDILNEPDTSRAESLYELAEKNRTSAAGIIPLLEKSGNHSLCWSLSYDILHQLAEAILLMECTGSEDHCVFTCICIKHPDWDLSWEALMTMRHFRSGIGDDGQAVSEESWKEQKLRFTLYTSLFRGELAKLLGKKDC